MDEAGNLYGATGYGGTGPCLVLGVATGCGTVYELSPPAKAGDPWTEKVLYSFQGGGDGDLAQGSLVFDGEGDLYGATWFGGGHGTTAILSSGEPVERFSSCVLRKRKAASGPRTCYTGLEVVRTAPFLTVV